MSEFSITDLDKLRQERVNVDNCIRDLERGISQTQAKLSQYEQLIQNPTIPDTEGLTYDVEMLKSERDRIRLYALDIEQAYNKEVVKLARLDTLILEGEKILGNFGDCTGTGQQHDWQILEMFDVPRLRHQWKRRKCRKCGATQNLGYD